MFLLSFCYVLLPYLVSSDDLMKVITFEENKFFRGKFSYALIDEHSLKPGLNHFILCLSMFNIQPDGSNIMTISSDDKQPFITFT